MFTMEYSVRSALEAVSVLFSQPELKPPPVYQGQFDPYAVAAALEKFL